MMLAYQPVKTLTKVNVGIGQGLSCSRKNFPIIDIKMKLS